jgi:hypothetical protein
MAYVAPHILLPLQVVVHWVQWAVLLVVVYWVACMMDLQMEQSIQSHHTHHHHLLVLEQRVVGMISVELSPGQLVHRFSGHYDSHLPLQQPVTKEIRLSCQFINTIFHCHESICEDGVFKGSWSISERK